MEQKICYVVGAGENYGLDFAPRPGDMVIAADAGLQYLEQVGIEADLAIGDFDSLHFVPRHPCVMKLNAEKDDTDMAAAIREGVRAGYDLFHLYCGTGGRIDHTIANLQLLAELSQHGRQGFLFGQDSVLTAVTDGTLGFSRDAAGFVSVFSHSERSEGVFLKGLKYELADAVLTNTFPLGVSNEFTGQESTITVGKGTLLVVFPRAGMSRLKKCMLRW